LLVQRYNFRMDAFQPTASDRRLYTAAQVRQIDQSAINDFGIPGIDLMERAGKAAFETIVEQYPGRRHWLVTCGGGNNGGDGYVVARLAHQAGIDCHLVALKAPDALGGDAAIAAARWLQAGGRVDQDVPSTFRPTT
jgi:NAD(P)H-hydrate epimerase